MSLGLLIKDHHLISVLRGDHIKTWRIPPDSPALPTRYAGRATLKPSGRIQPGCIGHLIFAFRLLVNHHDAVLPDKKLDFPKPPGEEIQEHRSLLLHFGVEQIQKMAFLRAPVGIIMTGNAAHDEIGRASCRERVWVTRRV